MMGFINFLIHSFWIFIILYFIGFQSINFQIIQKYKDKLSSFDRNDAIKKNWKFSSKLFKYILLSIHF